MDVILIQNIIYLKLLKYRTIVAGSGAIVLAMFKELSKNTFIQLVQLLEDILFLGTLQLSSFWTS